MSKNILLLINPKSRTGSTGAEQLESMLIEAGHKLIKPLENEDWKKFVSENRDKADIVLLGGGDGTVNYVLPVLVETQLPFVLFPLGTANLLARSFNIKADAKEVLEIINSGVPIQIDLGKVNGIYFINVCGLGVSTEVNKSVPSKLKKAAGPFSFWIHGARVLNHLNPFKIKMTVDDETPVTIKTWQVTICNGKKYAAWMTIEPNAAYDDGKLRCLSTEIGQWWEGLRLLPCYIKGTYKEDLDISFRSGKKIKIESKKPISIDVDGDVQTSTPALFEVHSKALKIILPPSTIQTEEAPISRIVN